MNKKQNNRNKLPLLLAALLTLSLIIYGSFAYFSDEAKQNADLEIELGNVNLQSIEDEGWKPFLGDNEDYSHITVNHSDTELPNTTKISNARPGDRFTRDFIFKNSGTLDAQIEINTNLGSYGLISVTVEDIKKDDNSNMDVFQNNKIMPFSLEEGEQVTVTLGVEILSNTSLDDSLSLVEYNENYNKAEKYALTEEISQWATEAVDVKAVQENYSEMLNNPNTSD